VCRNSDELQGLMTSTESMLKGPYDQIPYILHNVPERRSLILQAEPVCNDHAEQDPERGMMNGYLISVVLCLIFNIPNRYKSGKIYSRSIVLNGLFRGKEAV
jgi:hypothetical protein